MADNNISGFLPNFPVSLQELDLSNQKVTNGGGLIGPITGMTNFDKLIDLTTLNLAGNQLTGDIPASTANLLKLKVLNLSSNVLSSTIPSELGRLKGKKCFA
jgi:Leucine-rich repeat (LRR) protein